MPVERHGSPTAIRIVGSFATLFCSHSWLVQGRIRIAARSPDMLTVSPRRSLPMNSPLPVHPLPAQPGRAGLGRARTRTPFWSGWREYEHSSFAELKYTENDIEELAKVLAEGGYEVTLLTTTRGKKDAKLKPTASNIRAQLRRLSSQVTRNDMLLIGLSGHGVSWPVVDPKTRKEKEESFFCPADDRLNSDETLDELRKTMIPLGELFRRLEESGAGVRLMLVDACRNEVKGTRRNVDVDNLPRTKKGTAVLFSCKSGEVAFETDKLGKGHGVFFYHVIRCSRARRRFGTAGSPGRAGRSRRREGDRRGADADRRRRGAPDPARDHQRRGPFAPGPGARCGAARSPGDRDPLRAEGRDRQPEGGRAVPTSGRERASPGQRPPRDMVLPRLEHRHGPARGAEAGRGGPAGGAPAGREGDADWLYVLGALHEFGPGVKMT